MKQYNAAHFRKNMSKTFDHCEKSNEPLLITTRKDGRDEPQQMIVISKAEYDRLIDSGSYDRMMKED